MSGSTEMNQSSIGALFTLEAHLASTRSADLHRAFRKSDGERVGLWILRQPLVSGSTAARRFINRLELLSQPGSPVRTLESYGVDSAGVAFAVVSVPRGEPITGGAPLEAKEAERRFLQCLRIVELLHRAGLVCGDICDSSFWMNDDGAVELLGVLGSFDAEAASTAVLPPLDTLHYVAPEQRSGGGVEQASDVYSLGVLAYRLYTGAFPGEVSTILMGGVLDLLSIKPLSAYNDSTPFWVEEVVLRCLEPQPVKRFSSAGELIEAIREVKEEGRLSASLPVPSQPSPRRELVAPSVDPLVQQSFGKIPVEEEKVVNKAPVQKGKKRSHRSIRLMIAGLSLLTTAFVVVVGDMVLRNRAPKAVTPSELTTHREAAGSDQLKQAIDVVSHKGSSLQEKETYLDQISRSDDPLSHDILVKSARDGASPEERMLAEKAIFQRTRRLGFGKAASQVESWLARYAATGALPSGYEAVLKALNVTLPIAARNSVMQAAYSQAQEMALKLEAAVALDSPNPEQFQLALASSVGDALARKDAANRSALALIYAHPLLAVTFEKDLEVVRDKVSDEELLWVLEILVQRSDVLSKGLLQYLVDKRELSPIREQYLVYLLGRTDIPVDIASALVRLAANQISVADLRVIGGWFDMTAPRVLLAVLVQAEDAELVREAFDLLAGRPVESEPSDTLLRWIKSNKWAQRAEYARAVGVFALLDKVQPVEFERATRAVELISAEPSLVQAIMDSNSPTAIRVVAERHADKMGLGLLLQLLRHEDKGVRIIGVRHLKGYNDLGALKFIIDNYEREKDPEVRKVYQETFWVIRQRQGR